MAQVMGGKCWLSGLMQNKAQNTADHLIWRLTNVAPKRSK